MFAKLAQNVQFIAARSWSFLRPKNRLGVVSFILLSSIFVVVWLVSTPVANAGVVTWVRDTFADIFFALAGFLIKLTFWALKFVIEIGGYNGYIDSPAVTVGWVMVRDMTNMFFVVLLLIISFGTILGLEHYEYKKLLVKVLIAAVIVNFSRIICGVIIDIAQVVMVTFINGIAATASGNLVNMFNVQEIFKLGSGADAKLTDGNMIFLASVAALVFGTMMFITMMTFVFLLMARMAMLWVLIVLSPFAFVLNVLPQTEKYASQWWSQFGGHVVGGPVIAFFLWLSFVTVGTGSVHDDIKKYNSLPESSMFSGDPDNPDEQTGITEVMSWTNMANFVIAIAMLLAGAKMATELGMAGGEMMGAAKDWGKKVAMYASGFQAARWGAGKALEGAKVAGKWGLMNAPLVGGNAWKRRGIEIAGRVGRRWQRIQGWRNERAKDLEKSAKDLDELKVLKNKKEPLKPEEIARIKELEEKFNLSGSQRDQLKELREKQKKAKIAKEKKDKGEALEEGEDVEFTDDDARIMAELEGESKEVKIGSRFFGGIGRIVKGQVAGVIQTQGRAMKRAEDWRVAAEAEHEVVEESYSTSSFAGGKAKLTAQVRAHQAKELAEVKKKRKMIEEERRLTEKGGQFEDKEFQKREHVIFETKAIMEEKKEDLENQKALEVAEARDHYAMKRGEKPEYVATEIARQKEVKEKRLANLTFREITTRNAEHVNEMISLVKKFKDGKISETQFKSDRRRMAENLANTLTVCMKQGMETGLEGLNAAAKAIGFTDEIAPHDLRGQQRKILSVLLGQKVDKGGEEKAFEDFMELHRVEGDHGNARGQAILRSLDEAAKKTAAEGAPVVKGWLNDREVDKHTGFTRYKLEEDTDAGRRRAEDQQKYWRGGVPLAKLISLDGLITSTNGTITTEVGQLGERSAENFVAVFRKITGTTQLDGRLVDQWKNMADAVKNKLLGVLKDVDSKAAELAAAKLEGRPISSSPSPRSVPAVSPTTHPVEDDDDEGEEDGS